MGIAYVYAAYEFSAGTIVISMTGFDPSLGQIVELYKMTPSDSMFEVSDPYSPIRKLLLEKLKLVEVVWYLLEVP